MLWLYIIGGILLFIFILLLFSATLDITANNDELYIDVKYIFLKFRLYPNKYKPKKKKEKSEKRKKPKTDTLPSRNPQPSEEQKPQTKTVSETVNEKNEKKKKLKRKKERNESVLEKSKNILNMLEGTSKPIRRLIKHIRISISLNMTVGGENAAEAAISFGRYNALVWSALGQSAALMTLECEKVNIDCDFEMNRILFDLRAKIKLRLLTALIVGICIIFRVLVNTIKKEK